MTLITYTQIRDGQISKDEAIIKINELIPKIRKYFLDNGGIEFTNGDWVFPLRGYVADDIGGKNGSGYMSEGVVVAFDKEWDVNSNLRGGKFVMVYSPYSDAIFY